MTSQTETLPAGAEEPDSTESKKLENLTANPADALIGNLLSMLKRVMARPKVESGIMNPDHPDHDGFFGNNIAKLPQDQWERLNKETK